MKTRRKHNFDFKNWRTPDCYFLSLLIVLFYQAHLRASTEPVQTYRQEIPNSRAANVYAEIDDHRFLVGRFDELGNLKHYLLYDGSIGFAGPIINSEISVFQPSEPCLPCWSKDIYLPSSIPPEIHQQVVATYSNPGTGFVDVELPPIPEQVLSAVDDHLIDSSPQAPRPVRSGQPKPKKSKADQKDQRDPSPNEDAPKSREGGTNQAAVPGHDGHVRPSSSLLDESLFNGVGPRALQGGLAQFGGAVARGEVQDYQAAHERIRREISEREAAGVAYSRETEAALRAGAENYKLENFLDSRAQTHSGNTGLDLGLYGFRSQDQDFVTRAQTIQKRLREAPYAYAQSQRAQEIGYQALLEADNQDLLGDIETREVLIELGSGMADLMVGIDPFTSFARSAYELATGQNLFTEDPLTNFERGLAAFDLLTLGAIGSTKTAAKASIKVARKSADAIFRVISKFPGANAIGSAEKLVHMANQGRQYLKDLGVQTQRQAAAAVAVGRKLIKKTGEVSIEKARLVHQWVTNREASLSIEEAVNLADNALTSSPVATSNFVLRSQAKLRKINVNPLNESNWGLTPKHLSKHLFGPGDFSLRTIDPKGTADKWMHHLTELFQSPHSAQTANGMIDIIKYFDKADGSGTFKMGIRLSEQTNGTYDLVTILTKQ